MKDTPTNFQASPLSFGHVSPSCGPRAVVTHGSHDHALTFQRNFLTGCSGPLDSVLPRHPSALPQTVTRSPGPNAPRGQIHVVINFFSHAWEKGNILVPFRIHYMYTDVYRRYHLQTAWCPSLSNLIKLSTAQEGWHGFSQNLWYQPLFHLLWFPPPLGPAKWPGPSLWTNQGWESGISPSGTRTLSNRKRWGKQWSKWTRPNATTKKCLQQLWHFKLIQTRSKPSSKHDRDRRDHTAPT